MSIIGNLYHPFDNSYCINCETGKWGNLVQSHVGPYCPDEEDGASFEIVSEPYEEVVNCFGSHKHTFIKVKSSKTGNIYRTLYNKKRVV